MMLHRNVIHLHFFSRGDKKSVLCRQSSQVATSQRRRSARTAALPYQQPTSRLRLRNVVQEKVGGSRGLPRHRHSQRHPLSERLASLLDGRPVLESTSAAVSPAAGTVRVRDLAAAAAPAGQVRVARAARVLVRALLAVVILRLVAVETLVAATPPAPLERVVVPRGVLLFVFLVRRSGTAAAQRRAFAPALRGLGRGDSSARRRCSARGAVSPGRKRRYLARRRRLLLLLSGSWRARWVESHDVSRGEQVSEHLLVMFLVVAPGAVIRGKRGLLHALSLSLSRAVRGRQVRDCGGFLVKVP